MKWLSLEKKKKKKIWHVYKIEYVISVVESHHPHTKKTAGFNPPVYENCR